MELDVAVPAWAREVLSDLTDMHRNARPVDPARVSRFRLRLPDDVYFEYGFRDADGRIRADPDRPERADNPWYPELSAVRGPEYAPHPLASVDPDLATGRLRRLRVEDPHLGEDRRVAIYEPEGADGPLPLVVAHDGTAYLRVARLPAVLEALRADGRVPAVRVAFVDPSRPDRRTEEYGFGEAYQRFLRGTLLPRLREEADATGGTYLLGASLGGLASAVSALHDPDAVAGLALQSPALLGTPDDRDFFGGRRSWLVETLAADDGTLPWRVYQEIGTMDWLRDANREAAERLAQRVDAPRYVERSAGHNWTFWRDGLAPALEHLLGGRAVS